MGLDASGDETSWKSSANAGSDGLRGKLQRDTLTERSKAMHTGGILFVPSVCIGVSVIIALLFRFWPQYGSVTAAVERSDHLLEQMETTQETPLTWRLSRCGARKEGVMVTVTRSMHDLTGLTPPQIRQRIRAGQWRRPTAGLAPGYTQANLVIVPRALAYDFLLFCQRNPQPCPLLEVLDVGNPAPREFAPGADIRTDIPRYRVYRDGVLAEEVDDITPYWRDDLVGFLLGCSFTFEHPS